jgi:hypothetical protein
VPNNPKRQGSKARRRFSLYDDGITVAEYYDKCVRTMNDPSGHQYDIEWDLDHKFIKLV